MDSRSGTAGEEMSRTLWIMAPIAFVAFGIEATVGFGATVFMVTTAALFLPIDTVLPIFVPANLGLSAYLATRYFNQIDRRLLLLRVIPLMAIGLPVGIALFNLENETWLKRAFGAFVILLAVIELVGAIRDGSPEDQGSRSRKPLIFPAEAGLLSLGGFIHGIFGSGGPIVVYVVSRRVSEKGVFRATLAALWFVANLSLAINYALTSHLSRSTLGASALLLVPLAGGLAAGEWIHKRISVAAFRVGVFAVLLIGGILLVWKG